MGDIGQKVSDEILRLKEKVKCGYLRVDFDLMEFGHSYKKSFQNEGFIIACMSPKCGPKHECDICNGKSCEYRSLQTDDALDKQPEWLPF